jgi:hypothetical protein
VLRLWSKRFFGTQRVERVRGRHDRVAQLLLVLVVRRLFRLLGGFELATEHAFGDDSMR